MKRAVFIVALLGIFAQHMFGQISEGGTPISFSSDFDAKREVIPLMTMPLVDARALNEEDERLESENVQRPFRFGYLIHVDIDIKKDGIKIELLDGGSIYLLKIHCPDAFSINLIYNRFFLGEGSKFFIYNEEKTMVLGAFTPEVSNNQYNEFATDLVQGNSIILEYYEPKTTSNGIINISKVIHGYVNIFSRGLGDSAPCNVDILCALGNNWRNEQRSISMLLVDNNTAFCSGCLINNTQQDFKPYILTANHCLDGSTNTWIFRFLYWKPNCGSGNPTNWQSITGATLRANYEPSDFALLQLSSSPPATWNLYYAGWDRTATPAQNSTGIHHPRGDAMKISYEQHPVVAAAWSGTVQNHWEVQHFEQGTVQGGSSGSPLFNQNRRIVGQLHGGDCLGSDNNCVCNNPMGLYGRLDISWTGGGTNETRLINWLAPGNNPPQTLDGMYQPYISGPTLICTSSIYSINNLPQGSSISWSSSSSSILSLMSAPNTNNAIFQKVSDGQATIYATITIGSNTISLSKKVSVGVPSRPHLQDASGKNYTTPNPSYTLYYGNPTTSQQFHFVNPPGSASADAVFEKVLNPSHFTMINLGTFVNTIPLCVGGGTFTAKGINECGTSLPTTMHLTIKNPSTGGGSGGPGKNIKRLPSLPTYSQIISPNPAFNEISVTILEEAEYEIENGDIETFTTLFAEDVNYTLQLWSDQFGLVKTVVSNQAIVQIPVNDLSSGIYYLHFIIDGQILDKQKVIIY
ncbi:MAG: serine protease [Marinilabiliaceae bacterium]|nr:serine protease [Marinilabiliaceae bacterium]